MPLIPGPPTNNSNNSNKSKKRFVVFNKISYCKIDFGRFLVPRFAKTSYLHEIWFSIIALQIDPFDFHVFNKYFFFSEQ